jgi:hypothetical protein
MPRRIVFTAEARSADRGIAESFELALKAT